MKGSSTIRTNFPATPESLRGIQLDSDEDAEEFTTVLPITTRTGAKTIPFGSTLSERPLRVRYDREGKVVLTTSQGDEVAMKELPEWERRELFRHIQFASDRGAL